MQRYEFSINTAYRIIELTDSDKVPERSWSETGSITDEDLDRWIKIVPGIITVFTMRDGRTSLAVELHETQPDSDFSAWDHVAEASQELLSGLLIVSGLYDVPETVVKIPLKSNWYRVRVHCAHLDFVTDPNDSTGADYYLLRFWPAISAPLIVHKQYAPGRAPVA